MKKNLILKLIESNDTPKIGDIVRMDNKLYTLKDGSTDINHFIATDGTVIGYNRYSETNNKNIIKPILISDEEIKDNQPVLGNQGTLLNECPVRWRDSGDWKVIAVTSEQIPTNILEAIVKGKIVDGDSVEVEYENRDYCGCADSFGITDDCGDSDECDTTKLMLKLDSNNKVICSILPEVDWSELKDCKSTPLPLTKETTKEVSKIMYSEEEVKDLFGKLIAEFQLHRGIQIGIELPRWFEQNKKK